MSMETAAGLGGLRWGRALQSSEFRSRLTFTILALLAWRVLHWVPLPGLNPAVIRGITGSAGRRNA